MLLAGWYQLHSWTRDGKVETLDPARIQIIRMRLPYLAHRLRERCGDGGGPGLSDVAGRDQPVRRGLWEALARAGQLDGPPSLVAA